jgi:hypothetical protein
MERTVFAGDGYVPLFLKKEPEPRQMGVFEVGDMTRYKIYKQCLIFYEDFSLYLKAYLEF